MADLTLRWKSKRWLLVLGCFALLAAVVLHAMITQWMELARWLGLPLVGLISWWVKQETERPSGLVGPPTKGE